jgi:type IX secretion system PorP/SprF family membrane protein
MKLIVFLTILLCFFFQKNQINAQDAHFIFYKQHPMLLNPALTGAMEDSLQHRLVLGRRHLLGFLNSNGFQTAAIEFDQKINLPKGKYLGFGGSLFRDWVDGFESRSAHISSAYGLRLSRNDKKFLQSLSLGFDLAFAQKKIDGILEYPNFVIDTIHAHVNYPDFSAGILWKGTFLTKSNVYAGISFQHVNRPNISFNGNDFPLFYPKIVIHVGGIWMFNRYIGVEPSGVLYIQGPSHYALLGNEIIFVPFTEHRLRAIKIGLNGQFAQGLNKNYQLNTYHISARAELKRLSFGYNYETVVSSLRKASGSIDGWEMVLGYRF